MVVEFGFNWEGIVSGIVGFFVKCIKKGKFFILYENRVKGKKVMVISNVIGDCGILL